MNDVNSSDVLQSKKDSNYEKAVQKRRSSVFQSRAVAFDEHEGTRLAENDRSVDAKAVKVPQEEETFNLEEYIVSLRKERKQWIETLKRRKAERRTLASQKLSLESQGQPLDFDVLSDSEKAFLSARPNYQHIYRNNKKLSDIAVRVSALNRLVYKFNQRFILQMEKRLLRVTEKVIETSES